MKAIYMENVYAALVQQKNYYPVKDEDGLEIQNERIKVVQKMIAGKLMVVELIDADSFSQEQISHKLGLNRNWLVQMGNMTVYYLQVFIFYSWPQLEKLQSIQEGQMEDVYIQKYMPCLCVDLTKKYVTKMFNLPIKIDDVEGILNSMFDLYNSNQKVDDSYDYLSKEIMDEQIYSPRNKKIPYLTYGLIAINIIIWIIMNLFALVEDIDVRNLFILFGAKENLRILSGEYWRFLTPVFLHADIQHLLMNCLSLFVLGKMVEGLFGHRKFLFIYVLSGVIGNIASFIFSPAPALGASGSIFGLFGALFYFSIENPKLFKKYFGRSILIWGGINLIYGFTSPGIDNFGHIGGLIGGFLTSGIVKVQNVSNKFMGRSVFIAATLIIVIVSLYFGFSR